MVCLSQLFLIVVIFSSCQANKITADRCEREVDIPPVYKEVKKEVLTINGYETMDEIVIAFEGGLKRLEVLCDEELTSKTRKIIQESLEKKGYEFESEDEINQDELLEKLTQYQLDNRLERGHFTINSLRHLGIKF